MARYLIAALAVAVGVAACSEEVPELRQADVEAAVDGAMDELAVLDVSCPAVSVLEPIPEGEFRPTACTGVLSGDPITLRVALIRVDAESIEVTVAIDAPILDVSVVEADAAARLNADLGGSPVVSCAEAHVRIEAGREISCRVTADGGTAGPVDRPVVVTILDGEGNWELDLTP